MPGFDGKGPEGKGAGTGRKLGPCSNDGKPLDRPFGFGRGTGRGLGRGFGRGRGSGRGFFGRRFQQTEDNKTPNND